MKEGQIQINNIRCWHALDGWINSLIFMKPNVHYPVRSLKPSNEPAEFCLPSQTLFPCFKIYLSHLGLQICFFPSDDSIKCCMYFSRIPYVLQDSPNSSSYIWSRFGQWNELQRSALYNFVLRPSQIQIFSHHPIVKDNQSARVL